MATRTLHKVTSQATQKTIETAEGKPAKATCGAVVVNEARERLEIVLKHLRSVDLMVANMPETDDWAHAMGFCLQGLKTEVADVHEYLGKTVLDGQGNITGTFDEE